MSLDLETGGLVAGRYRLEQKLGEGGMGMVWSAVQTVTRKSVALKFLKEKEGASSDLRKRFLREARAACAVQHVNVVEIYDVLELEDGAPVMVMEMLRGEAFASRLEREGRIGAAALCDIMLPVVSAVGTAHSLGIVHRDLKPDNIFLAQRGGATVVKVLDFGIAKLTKAQGDAAETAGLTGTGALLGTPYYMSPEQAFGEKSIDHRSDIWSLGVIMYQALTGNLPTRADNVGQIFKTITMGLIDPIETVSDDIPDDLARLVSMMLSVSVDERPADLSGVSAVLRAHSDVSVASFGAPAGASTKRRSDSVDESAREARIRVDDDAATWSETSMSADTSDASGAAAAVSSRQRDIGGTTGEPLSITAGGRQTLSRAGYRAALGAAVAAAGIGVLVYRGSAPSVAPATSGLAALPIPALAVPSAASSASQTTPPETPPVETAAIATPSASASAQVSPTAARRRRPPGKAPQPKREQPPQQSPPVDPKPAQKKPADGLSVQREF